MLSIVCACVSVSVLGLCFFVSVIGALCLGVCVWLVSADAICLIGVLGEFVHM